MKKRKTLVSLSLLALLLLAGGWLYTGRQSPEDRLFSQWFVDAPTKSEAMGIDPGTVEQEEAILLACREAGIEDPILPAAGGSGYFYQRTVYLPMEGEGRECRCTYYLYVEGDEVKSLWIEAKRVEKGFVSDLSSHIFSAKTSRADILQAI